MLQSGSTCSLPRLEGISRLSRSVPCSRSSRQPVLRTSSHRNLVALRRIPAWISLPDGQILTLHSLRRDRRRPDGLQRNRPRIPLRLTSGTDAFERMNVFWIPPGTIRETKRRATIEQGTRLWKARRPTPTPSRSLHCGGSPKRLWPQWKHIGLPRTKSACGLIAGTVHYHQCEFLFIRLALILLCRNRRRNRHQSWSHEGRVAAVVQVGMCDTVPLPIFAQGFLKSLCVKAHEVIDRLFVRPNSAMGHAVENEFFEVDAKRI